jgi:oxalate decarboxylase/phosphoglucose isomerase-like protein (cupin superfamily)
MKKRFEQGETFTVPKGSNLHIHPRDDEDEDALMGIIMP